MRREVLRIERVSCGEQGVTQLDGFCLSILSGEIIGLLPVNNHGLTAFLRLIQHNTPLRSGYVYYMDEQVNTWRGAKQRYNRIGLIQSEGCLVEGLTVADNIFVLRPGFKTWLLRPAVLRKQLAPFLESVNIYISADTYAEELTAFEKVVVNVLKFVVAGCKLIVLRDISASVSEADLEKIHRLLKHYARQGLSFLYIDFHFEELCRVCDKTALMTNGRVVKILPNDNTAPGAFNDYIGAARQYSPAPAENSGRVAFRAKKITGSLVKNLSFAVAAGECIALQNADVQVIGEFLSFLNGESVPGSGCFYIGDKAASPRIGGDIAVIPELPTETMLFKEMSYPDNLCFSLDRRMPEVWRDRRVREGVRREYAGLLGEDVFDKRIDALTEIQKYELIYTRVAIQNPKAVFCVQPFRRADMELRAKIAALIKKLLDKGIAVVILAVNLTDSLPLADRLIRIE